MKKVQIKLVKTLILSLFISGNIFAQQKTVTGIVKDATDGSTLPGATIMVKGTTVGTSTDVNGAFSISAKGTDTLLVSFVGKNTQTIPVNNRTVIESSLEDDASMIEEVVVQAFGKVKKSSVVSSITSVNTKDLRIPSSNFTTALAGRVAGLISFQTSGEPGADNAQFFVRGVTTLGYKADPLILIDGFESTTDDLARLKVDDIESFSVLKDASATVMYGARAANGIVSVATKSGREGDTKISLRVDVNMAEPTRKIDFLDGVEYMKLYNEAQITRTPLLGAYYSEQKIQATERGEYPMIYPNINWYDYMFKERTWNEKVNLNVSGGGKVATYYVAAGYEHETGLLKVDTRNNFNSNISITRANARTNVIFKLTPTTTLDTRINAQFERYTGPFRSTSKLFVDIMDSNPVEFPPLYEPDAANELTEHQLFGSTMIYGGYKFNPYANMVYGYRDRNSSTVVAQLSLRQDLKFITEGLSANLKVSADTRQWYQTQRSFQPYMYALQNFNQITGEYSLLLLNPTSASSYLGGADISRDGSSQFYYEGNLLWSREFGQHSVGAQLVGTIQENLYAGTATDIYTLLPERNNTVAGRFNYDFNDRYYLEFSFGYNGSEKFTGDQRFGFFPAFAGAWAVSNEKFFAPLKNIVSLFKIRATYGKGGNDAIGGRGDRFRFLSTVELTDSPYNFGNTFMTNYGSYNVKRYANTDITWEVSTKENLGLDLSFLKNEPIRLIVDFFAEQRSRIYWNRENYPATAGLEADIAGNVGAINTRGIDGSLDFEYQFSNDFWMQSRINCTYSTNSIVEIDEKNFPDKYLRRKGHPSEQKWGLIGERLFVDDAEIVNSPKQDWGEYMAGDIKYKDVNGDGVVNDNDRVAMGFPTTPEVQYGFGASLGYKNWDFSFFFQGNARVSMFINAGVGGGADDPNDDDYGTEGIAPFVSLRNALPIVARDYWSETNPNPHAFWPRLSTLPINNNTQQSSWWLRDMSFMRLKTMELGYTLPGLEKFHLAACRFYLQCENLFVVSKFKLWDPEMGRKGLKYPPNRRFNIGVKLDF